MQEAVDSSTNTTEGASASSRFRSRKAVIGLGTVGVAGILGGLTAGAGLFASAATTGVTLQADLSVCANPPVAPPATPLYVKKFTVGGGKVSGTVPAPTAAQLQALNITPTLVEVIATTSYNSGRSGAGKTDVATVTLPGHSYNNPLLFNIPPVTNSINVGTGTVAYSAQTTGKAVANVTIIEQVVQATSLTPAVVAGTACPAGTTKVSSLQTATTARPAAPTAVTATPGGAGALSNDTAPNNGAVTVKFTPSANNGVQVEGYAILPIDLTAPNTVQSTQDFLAPTDATSTTQQSHSVSGLNTGHVYQFQVFAISNLGQVSVPSTATTPGVTPTVETQQTTTQAQSNAKAATLK